jgi:hypothetical protein
MILYIAVLIYGAFAGVIGLAVFFETESHKIKWIIYRLFLAILFGLLWFIGWAYIELTHRKKNLH